MERRKLGWSGKGIAALILLPMGLIYLVLGIGLYTAEGGGTREDTLVFLCVFGGIGAIFVLISLLLLHGDLRRRRGMRRAIESGNYVMAHVAGVQVKTNVRTNGNYPRVVECHYKDPVTGDVHIYYSRYLYFDPTDMLTADEVPVYLDRYDERNAYVDIDAILPKVVIHR